MKNMFMLKYRIRYNTKNNYEKLINQGKESYRYTSPFLFLDMKKTN